MAKNENKIWTINELNTIQDITEGLRLNGWNLQFIDKIGKAWHFIIVPLEEVVDEK